MGNPDSAAVQSTYIELPALDRQLCRGDGCKQNFMAQQNSTARPLHLHRQTAPPSADRQIATNVLDLVGAGEEQKHFNCDRRGVVQVPPVPACWTGLRSNI